MEVDEKSQSESTAGTDSNVAAPSCSKNEGMLFSY